MSFLGSGAFTLKEIVCSTSLSLSVSSRTGNHRRNVVFHCAASVDARPSIVQSSNRPIVQSSNRRRFATSPHRRIAAAHDRRRKMNDRTRNITQKVLAHCALAGPGQTTQDFIEGKGARYFQREVPELKDFEPAQVNNR